MSGKKNGGYGCGTVVAILVILSFLAEFVPVAATISVIVVICALIYKKITDGKGNSNNNIQTSNSYELNKDLEKSTNESASVSQSDDIYRKNKVISEKNFEISEKNEIIDKLNKKEWGISIEIPNDETIEAMQELENGGGIVFEDSAHDFISATLED